MKGRVRGLHRETFPDGEWDPPGAARAEPPEQTGAHPGGDVQQALQMLTLAQRTAEEHVAGAHRQGEQIPAEARATAEQGVRDAQARADAVRRAWARGVLGWSFAPWGAGFAGVPSTTTTNGSAS